LRGHLMMSGKERQRLLVLSRVRDQGMSLKKAAKVLSVSYRQTRRIYKRFIDEGDQGLVHQSRGKTSGRGFDLRVKQTVIDLYKSKYDGFGPTLAAEKLLEEDSIVLDHETLRRWLIKNGLLKRRRKRPSHRKRREPKAHFGELIQMDGSHHLWFEDRSFESCLMNMVDDATKTTLSLMDKEETTLISMRLLLAWIDKYGIPETLYVDRKNVFVTDREPTLEEQLKGETPLTHFGRACKKLGIQIIIANSAQAKGRVERNHGVYQDRLVKEFRLKGINTIDQANEVLASGFVDNLNTKFAKAPADPKDRHRPVDKTMNLASIFSFEHQRTVGNDFTVRFNNRLFQLLRQNYLPQPKTKLTVKKRLDDSIHLIHQDRELKFVEITKEDQEESTIIAEQKPKKIRTYVPPPDHPWRGKQREKQLIGQTR